MKIKPGFVLKTVADEIVALPTGGATERDMMITLNSTARFLWEILAEGAEEAELVAALIKEYGIDEETAHIAVDRVVDKLRAHDLLE